MIDLGRRRRRLDTTALVYLALLGVVVVGAVLTASSGRNFFSTGNIIAILTLTSTLGFVAIGQTERTKVIAREEVYT